MDKQTLSQYQYLRAEIIELKQQRQDIIASLGAAPVSSGIPRGKGSTCNPTARIAVNLAELQQLIDVREAQCLDLCAQIEKAIGALPARERRILRLRYIKGLSWPRVTERIYGKRGDYYERYDSYLRQVYRLHGRGISRIL